MAGARCIRCGISIPRGRRVCDRCQRRRRNATRRGNGHAAQMLAASAAFYEDRAAGECTCSATELLCPACFEQAPEIEF